MKRKTRIDGTPLVYTGLSLAAGLIFLVAASLLGQYNAVARIGGTVWVFMLGMIVTMPLVTGRIKKQSHSI